MQLFAVRHCSSGHDLHTSCCPRQGCFAQGMWTCSVCLEEVAGAQCLRPAECGHFYCRACVAGQAAVHVAEGALDALRCPDLQCRAPFLRQVSCKTRSHYYGAWPLGSNPDTSSNVK